MSFAHDRVGVELVQRNQPGPFGVDLGVLHGGAHVDQVGVQSPPAASMTSAGRTVWNDDPAA